MEENKKRGIWRLAGMDEDWQKRTKICAGAVILQGFFLSFLIKIGFGTDPCTFMNVSIAGRIGWTLGNWQLLLNICLLAAVVLTSRLQYLGFGTTANMVLIGYTADFCCYLWNHWIPETIFMQNGTKIPLFVVTLTGFLVFAAMYMNSGLGQSPYDAPPSIIRDHLPKIPYVVIRICWDFAAILIGMAAGGRPTVGNIIMAVALGPVISAIGRWMKKWLT